MEPDNHVPHGSAGCTCTNEGEDPHCRHHGYEAEIRRLRARIEFLELCANSARTCLERHRATRGTNDLLDTAVRELDDACPPYVEFGNPPASAA